MLPFVGSNFEESNFPRSRRYSQDVIQPLQDHPNDAQENLVTKTRIPQRPCEHYYNGAFQMNDDRIFLSVEVPGKKEKSFTRVYEVYGQHRNREYTTKGYFNVELDTNQKVKDVTIVYVGLGNKNFTSFRTKDALINRIWDSSTLKLAVHTLREEFSVFGCTHPKPLRSLHLKLLLEMLKKFFHDVEDKINGNDNTKDCGEKVLVKFKKRGAEIVESVDEPLEEDSQEKANSTMQLFHQTNGSHFTGMMVDPDSKHFQNDHHLNRRDSLCKCTEFMEQLEHLKLHSHFHSLEHTSQDAEIMEPFKMRKYQCPTMIGNTENDNEVPIVLPTLLRNSLMNANPFNNSAGVGGKTGVGGAKGNMGPGLPVSIAKEGQSELVLPSLFETIRFHVLNGNLTAIVNPHMEETQLGITPGNPKLLSRRESIPLLHERTAVLDGRLEQNKRFKPAMFWTADGEHHYHNLNPIRGVQQNKNTQLFHNFSIDHKFAMASVAGILAEKSQISLKGLVKKHVPNSSLKNTRSIQKVASVEDKKMPNERIATTGERRCSIQPEPRYYGKGVGPITLPESGEHIKSKLWSDLRVGPGSMNRNRIKEQGVKTVYKLMAITQATAFDTNKKLANITNIANKFAVYKKIAYML